MESAIGGGHPQVADPSTPVVTGKTNWAFHKSCAQIRNHGQDMSMSSFVAMRESTLPQQTFNAMTKTPLARLRIKDKMDEYIDCMRGDTTLRTAAKKCGISLSSSFRMRHRLMAVIEPDKADLLVGISEIDETFFRESFKGQRSLERPARKRGGRKHCGHGKKEQEAVKQIPVMVACDRENHVTDAVLEHISTDELAVHLKLRVQASVQCNSW